MQKKINKFFKAKMLEVCYVKSFTEQSYSE